MGRIDQEQDQMNLYPRGLRKHEVEAEIRRIIRRGAERLLTVSPRCLCDFLPDMVSQQVVGALRAMDVRAFADFDHIFGDVQMTARGWTTTRGVGGRRASIDVAVGRAKRRRGRPRTVFLTEHDRDMAASIMDHVRATGPDHLRQRLRDREVAVWQPGEEGHWTPALPWSALFDPRIQRAIEVLETASALSDARYTYRRNGLVNQLLAAVAECSVSRIKRPLPTTFEELWGERGREVPEAARATLERLGLAEREREAGVSRANDEVLTQIASGMVMEKSAEDIRKRLRDSVKPGAMTGRRDER